MTRGVCYLHIGSRHAVHLVVSLMTLRRYWNGKVAILTDWGGDGYETASLIADDERLGKITVIAHQWIGCGGVDIAYRKIYVPDLSPFQETCFLDSDTAICGDISPIFPSAGEVVFTHRNNGPSGNVCMRLRMQKWRDIQPDRAERLRDRNYPFKPINTGIFGVSARCTDFVREWQKVAALRQIESSDEQAAQLVFPDYEHRVLPEIFNGNVSKDNGKPCIIWHGVRNGFWKRRNGKAIFRPLLQQAWYENIGSIRELIDAPSDVADNKSLESPSTDARLPSLFTDGLLAG